MGVISSFLQTSATSFCIYVCCVPCIKICGDMLQERFPVLRYYVSLHISHSLNTGIMTQFLNQHRFHRISYTAVLVHLHYGITEHIQQFSYSSNGTYSFASANYLGAIKFTKSLPLTITNFCFLSSEIYMYATYFVQNNFSDNSGINFFLFVCSRYCCL